MEATNEGTGGLPPLQAEVARTFFSLEASRDFRLAGGAALLVLQLSRRGTRDLDLFTSGKSVEIARTAFCAEAARRGWTVRTVRADDVFCQLRLRDPDHGEEVLVDMGVDAAPVRGPVSTPVGTTFDPEELAGQKLLALFSRAEARDFVDVFVLARRFGSDLLLQRAAEIDAGFDIGVLADMIGSLDRFRDRELPTDEPDDVRAFFREWAVALRAAR